MNPPLPVTQILSFFSGQYGSNGNFASSEADHGVVVRRHHCSLLSFQQYSSKCCCNRGMRRKEDKNDDWQTTQ